MFLKLSSYRLWDNYLFYIIIKASSNLLVRFSLEKKANGIKKDKRDGLEVRRDESQGEEGGWRRKDGIAEGFTRGERRQRD